MFHSQGGLPQIFTVDNAEIQAWVKGTTTAASMVVQKVCIRSYPPTPRGAAQNPGNVMMA